MWGFCRDFSRNHESGNPGALESAEEAVSLCITMLGVMSPWTGILEIGQRDGLKAMEELAKLEEERGNPEYLPESGNVSASQRKKQGEAGKSGRTNPLAAGGKTGRVASNEMCTFLIINISSLQLIPVNMIAYRSQYGSVNPAAVVGPAIVATAVSTIAAVVFCKIMDRKRRI